MSFASPPLFATWLGYLTVILALAALLGATVALIARRNGSERAAFLERWAPRCAIATAISTAVTTLVALSLYVSTPTSQNVHRQLFLAASLFTLSLTLAGWRERDAEVLRKAETRLLYLIGYVGCLALALAIVGMG